MKQSGGDDKIYILAGTHYQAIHFARQNDIPIDQIVYLYNDQALRGISGKDKELLMYGTFFDRQDWRYLADLAEARGFKITYVGDGRLWRDWGRGKWS